MNNPAAKSAPQPSAVHRAAGDAPSSGIGRSEVYRLLIGPIAKYLRNEVGLETGASTAAATQMVELIQVLWGGQHVYFVKEGWEALIDGALSAAEIPPASAEASNEEMDLEQMLDKPLTVSNIERAHAFYAEMDHGVRCILVKECLLDEALSVFAARGINAVIALTLGGGHIYFPKESKWITRKRDETIFRRMQTGNAIGLAREYGMSYTRIYQIARDFRKKLRAEWAAQRDAVHQTAPEHPELLDELPPLRETDRLASEFAARPRVSPAVQRQSFGTDGEKLRAKWRSMNASNPVGTSGR